MGIFALVKPKLVICNENRKEVVESVVSGCECELLTFDGVAERVLLKPVEGLEESFLPPALTFDTEKAIALILTTSGSTGIPKPIAISHAYMISHTLSTAPEDSDWPMLFINTSTSWTSIFLFYSLVTVFGGTRVVADRFLETAEVVETIQKYQVNYSFGTPDTVVALVKYCETNNLTLDSVRTYLTGGWNSTMAVREAFEKTIPNGKTTELYGLTECMIVSQNNGYNSGGTIMPRLTCKVVDEHGDRLGPNESGEICVKAQVPIFGNLCKETNQMVFDNDNFLHTGDVGYFNSAGFLFIEGRLKDTIAYRGVIFNTVAIEKFLVNELGLPEVCVMALEDRGEGGEPPAAAIVKPDWCQLTEEDIFKLTVQKLPAHQHLDGGVYFVKELPRSAISGKIKRFEVKQLLQKLSLSVKH